MEITKQSCIIEMNGRDKTLKYGLRQILKKSVKNTKIHFFFIGFHTTKLYNNNVGKTDRDTMPTNRHTTIPHNT